MRLLAAMSNNGPPININNNNNITKLLNQPINNSNNNNNNNNNINNNNNNNNNNIIKLLQTTTNHHVDAVHTVKALNGIKQNDKISYSPSPSITTCGNNTRDMVNNQSNMANGGILYAPITLQHQNGGLPGNDILRQIIANDVHQPMKVSNVNSRNMVIKTAPHGAVQITYRKMIHSLPEYKKPIHILPKPTTTTTTTTTRDYKSNFVGDPMYVTSSNANHNKETASSTTKSGHRCADSSLLALKPCSPSTHAHNKNSLGGNHNHSFLPSYVTTTSVSTQQSQCTGLTYEATTDFNSSIVSNNNSVPYNNIPLSTVSPSGGKQVNGSVKNLNITLPKIKKSPVISSIPLQSDSNFITNDKSLYTSSFNGDTGNTSLYTSSLNRDTANDKALYTSCFNGDTVNDKSLYTSSFNGDTGTDKSLYTSSYNGDTNFNLTQAHTFENNFEMEDVSDLICSTQNTTLTNGGLGLTNGGLGLTNGGLGLTNGGLGPMNDIDMDLLSMDIDSLDAITMTTFLQNETLFNSDSNDNFSLPTSSIVVEAKEKASNSSLIVSTNKLPSSEYRVPNLRASTIDTTSIQMLGQENIRQTGITNTTTPLHIDTLECNNRLVDGLDFKTRPNNHHQQQAENNNNEIKTFANNKLKNMNIIDVSPDTSSTSGGCKIILIGSWNAKDSRYTCLFGEKVVTAELIQNGVLRCYSPKHSAGKVKLCVLSDNGIRSNEVDFTIVNPADTPPEDKLSKHNGWMSITNRSLVVMLVERVSAIAEIIGVEGISKEVRPDVDYTDTDELKKCQEHLVGICKKLMLERVNFSFDYNVENTMTVLHLASAIGFTKLIQLLLKWVETNPNKLIKVEACPTQYDQFSLLPIMWSSAKGHFNTTCVLHQWVESTIEECDGCGCTAIDLAKECGHETIAEYLERLQKKSNAVKEISNQSEGCDHATSSTSIDNQSIDDQPLADDVNHHSIAFSPRTLGKTLARIQSMISDQDDVTNLADELNLDGEESLFETSPFTPRQRSLPDESSLSLNVHGQHSPQSPQTSSQSPFSRQAFQTAEFCEFFYKAKKIEKDFAELTLTDEEQQDLLRAANVIQSAYKTYKERRKRRDQEFCAAVLIQSYYRRYKQYAAFKKMQKGAVVIQNQYRAHREKSKKKVKAASTIQAYYRRYREKKNDCTHAHEDIQLKNKLQQQADRKVNRYLKQTSSRFSKEFPDNFVNDGSSSTSPEPS